MIELERAHKNAALACGRISGMLARRRISPQALAVARNELEAAMTIIATVLRDMKHGVQETTRAN